MENQNINSNLAPKCGILMYLKYEEFDFHRPRNLIFSSDMLYMANVVAIPNLKEWDLKFASPKQGTARDFLTS